MERLKNIFLSSQFIRYFIIGVSGVILDMATLVFFKKSLRLTATLAVVCNQAIVLFYNFNLNKHWTFGNKNLPYKQFARYLVLAGANYVFSVMAMYLFSDRLGLNYLLVRALSIAAMVLWNFYFYKYWVYV